MKYRIVQKNKGFEIQKKILKLFWINAGIDTYSTMEYHLGVRKNPNKRYFYYHTYEEALYEIDFLKNRYIKFNPDPKKYKNHTIYITRYWDQKTLYIDLSSGEHDTIYGTIYRRYSSDLERLKSDIYEYENKKYKEKEGEKVVKIFKVD